MCETILEVRSKLRTFPLFASTWRNVFLIHSAHYKFNYFPAEHNPKWKFSFLFPPLYERKLLETSFAWVKGKEQKVSDDKKHTHIAQHSSAHGEHSFKHFLKISARKGNLWQLLPNTKNIIAVIWNWETEILLRRHLLPTLRIFRNDAVYDGLVRKETTRKSISNNHRFSENQHSSAEHKQTNRKVPTLLPLTWKRRRKQKQKNCAVGENENVW